MSGVRIGDGRHVRQIFLRPSWNGQKRAEILVRRLGHRPRNTHLLLEESGGVGGKNERGMQNFVRRKRKREIFFSVPGKGKEAEAVEDDKKEGKNGYGTKEIE